MRAQVHTKTLLAALRFMISFAADKDIRHYLRTVHFEFAEDKLTLVATDGVIMAKAELVVTPSEWVPHTEPRTFMIPTNQLKPWLPRAAQSTEEHMEFVVSLDGHEVSIAGDDFVPEDGRFPDWRIVWPKGKKVMGDMAHYDAQKMARMVSAHAKLVPTGAHAAVEVAHAGGFSDDMPLMRVRTMLLLKVHAKYPALVSAESILMPLNRSKIPQEVVNV